jgi:hypothetical protein
MSAIGDFADEYRRYRGLGEAAMAQVSDEALNHVPSIDGNSIGMIVRHLSGNLISRFTDFLTADGEKPNRDREAEFEPRAYTRAELDALWSEGWAVLEGALAQLDDSRLADVVQIRGVPLSVHAALSRSMAHAAYHVGQIVLLARERADAEWQSLSIPRGQSAAYNLNPTKEKVTR